MRAFQTGKVTKAQLLESLERHRDQDSFRKGAFWNEDTGTGCGVGCSIHDFAPGAEQEHAEYETLFGIPAELAVLEDHIFETLSYDDGPHDLADWPLAFARAVPEGADLSTAAGRWVLDILTREDSPLAHARGRAAVREAATILQEWMDTGDPGPQFVMHITREPDPLWPGADPHSINAAAVTVNYVRQRTKDEPYTTEDMLLLTHIMLHAGLSHAQQKRPGSGDGEKTLRSDPAADLKMAEMLLEIIAASPTG